MKFSVLLIVSITGVISLLFIWLSSTDLDKVKSTILQEQINVGDKKDGKETENDLNKLRTNQSLSCSASISMETWPQDQEQVYPPKRIVFFETSGRSVLNPRQACSVESAVRVSGLPVQVFLMSSHLDLTDNTTCNLWKLGNISFQSLDPESILSGTPLEQLMNSTEMKNSKFHTVHLSDALRYALIYKFGGFYSDLDSVTIRDLQGLLNVVGIGFYGENGFVANGEFQFSPHHPLLWLTMELFAKKFTGKVRYECGPFLLTESIKQMYRLKKLEGYKTENVTVLSSSAFYPVKVDEWNLLWPKLSRTPSYWSELFANSYMVHFYGFSTNHLPVVRDPAHEAYSELGPKYCPLAFQSTAEFSAAARLKMCSIFNWSLLFYHLITNISVLLL